MYGTEMAVKIVFVEGAVEDFAAYAGYTDWSDNRVRDQGEKLSRAAAEKLIDILYIMQYPTASHFKTLTWRD